MEALIQERRRELHRYRVWMRQSWWTDPLGSPVWATIDREYAAEFRALSRIARQHRVEQRAQSLVLAEGDHFAGLPDFGIQTSTRGAPPPRVPR